MMDHINYVHEQLTPENKLPEFSPGDSIAVSYKIVEGDKQRIQVFKGTVIQIKGHGANKTFTVRKVSSGVGVERIFPINAPGIVQIDVLKKGKVRRAKLYYQRKLIGKKSKIKERKYSK